MKINSGFPSEPRIDRPRITAYIDGLGYLRQRSSMMLLNAVLIVLGLFFQEEKKEDRYQLTLQAV